MMRKAFVLLCVFLLLCVSNIAAQCTAGINSTPALAKGCSPFTIQLNDVSTGVVSNRVWDFGDGSSLSSAQNPIHTFTKATGDDTVFVVTLKTYCLGGDSSIATYSVTVYSPPFVDFSADITTVCALSDTICFTSLSDSGAGFVYNWNFGDNTSSSLYETCKVYSNDGTYSIVLTITDTNNCQQSVTKSNYIGVKKAPNPDFTVSPQIGCTPLAVTFTNTTNTTVDTISAWLWDFGDGASSLLQNPGIYTYTLGPDTPIVKLSATNNLGCTNSTTKALVIKPTPTATFTVAAEACAGTAATITYVGTADTSAAYVWNFDGGAIVSGSGSGPYNVLWNTSGNKTITLNIDANGCFANYSQQIYINPQPTVTVSSSAANDTICEGTEVVYTALPGAYPNYQFYLNNILVQDSAINKYRTSSLNTNDSVKVIATDIKGCTSEYSAPVFIHVKPLPVVSLTMSTNDTLCVDDSAMFVANPPGLNGGYIFSSGFAPIQGGFSNTLTYTAPTNYTVSVVATQDGCMSLSSNAIDVVVIPKLLPTNLNCSVSTDTTISFVWDAVNTALGYEVSIDGGAYGAPSSGALGLSHLVTGLSQNDSIVLNVRVLGPSPCMDTIVSGPVKCYAIPCESVVYNLPSSVNVCQGDSLLLSLTGLNPSTYSVSWNGGVFDTLITYKESPATSTLVVVSVINTAEPSCPAVNKQTNVNIIMMPNVTLSRSVIADSICLGTALTLQANPLSFNNYTFYNNTTALQSGASPFYDVPSVPGVYSFSVVTNNQGCLDTSNTLALTILPNQVLSHTTNVVNDSICDGVPVSIVAQPLGLANYDFYLNGLLVQSSSSDSLTLSSITPGVNVITINTLNYLGCESAPYNVTVVNIPYTPVTLSSNLLDTICNYQPVTFTASPAGMNNYQFYLNGDLVQSSTSITALIDSLESGDTVTVISTNALGCESIASNGIAFFVKPTADPVISGSDTVGLCAVGSTPITLSASADTSFSPVTYTWSTGAQASSINVNPAITTVYSVYTTYNGCQSKSDSITVAVDTQVPVVAVSSSSYTLCIGEDVLLTGTGNGITSQWFSATGDTLSNTQSVTVSPEETTTYTFKQVNNYCFATVDVEVVVDKCLSDISGPIPQIITPNGDGSNDFWIIPDIDYFPENAVEIYNRWGQLVYKNAPYDNTWRGQEINSGNDLPDGTYYYVVVLGGNTDKKHTGFVIIHR